MFCIASIWKMYSLPERRAGSPVHSSLGPRMAKSMPGALQQLGDRAARLLVAVVERTRAADPVEVLVARAGPTRSTISTPVERGGPVAALALVHAVDVRRVLHRPVRVAELGGEVALHQREVAPHVEDLVEDLDVDRADLVARLARRARPHLLRRDALEHRVGGDGDVRVLPTGGDTDGVAGRGHHLADLQHDLAWVERLAGGVRRAHRRAATAHGAGVGVEQLLPGEVLDRRAPKVSSSVSIRLGIGFIAPLGRSRSFRYMFIGDVNMCRSLVVGRMIEERDEGGEVRRPRASGARPASRADVQPSKRRQRVADERPLLEVGPARSTRCATPRRGSRRPR